MLSRGTEAPTERKMLDTAEPEEAIKSKAPVEEHTVPKALIEVEAESKAEKAKEAEETEENWEVKSKIISITELEEIWGPSSMAKPQLNCLQSSPPGRAGSSKPAGDRDSEEPNHLGLGEEAPI